jgi:PhnB protein
MKPLTPYLFFDGICREAMEFYKSCFGGKLELMTYADAPEGNQCPGGDIESAKDKIMHGCLTEGTFTLMASDNPISAPVTGDNIHLSVECSTMSEIQELFKALGDGGKVRMPLEDTFWGAHFGMLTDRFGIHWMLSFPLENQGK